jgi:hypothetical protein
LDFRSQEVLHKDVGKTIQMVLTFLKLKAHLRVGYKSVVWLSGSSCILEVIPSLEADNMDHMDDNPGESGRIIILG